MGHDHGMRFRVNPKYQTKYRVSNGSEYDRALVRRGDITVWISTTRSRAGSQLQLDDEALRGSSPITRSELP
jgi:hypothetical protein